MGDSARVPDRLAIDSSVLIAFFLGEPAGRKAKDEIFANPRKEAHCSHLALAETFYILCRRKTRAFATEALETLERTGYVKTHTSTGLDYAAAAYKCERKLSLADCYVLAIAKEIKGAAAFAIRELELEKEQQRKPFDVDVLFLQANQ